eukprot:g17902.t1
MKSLFASRVRAAPAALANGSSGSSVRAAAACHFRLIGAPREEIGNSRSSTCSFYKEPLSSHTPKNPANCRQTQSKRAFGSTSISRSTKSRLRHKLALLRDPDVLLNSAADSGGSVKQVRIALLGRSNVGKSTLFNRLVSGSAKSAKAIVHKRAGTTRDRLEGTGVFGSLIVHAIDTGGVEDVRKVVKSNLRGGSTHFPGHWSG